MTLHMKYGDRRSDGGQERLPSPWQSLMASVSDGFREKQNADKQ